MTPRDVVTQSHRIRREVCTRAALAARVLVFRYAEEGEPLMAQIYLDHQRAQLAQAREWRAKERHARTAPGCVQEPGCRCRKCEIESSISPWGDVVDETGFHWASSDYARKVRAGVGR